MISLLELIDELHLEDLKNDIHPSVFDVNEEYDMLIIRVPVIAKELKFNSIGFIITNEKSFLYDKNIDKFKELDNRFESPHEILNKAIDRLLKSFEKYRDMISDIEEDLYENKNSDIFMNMWLELKRDILRIERTLMRTVSAMDDFIDNYEDIDGFPVNNYVNLHEHLDRTLRSATLQYSKLDYLYNFYSARTNEKMNRLIYALTIISAIFLPLNLLVGFFGMNTSGLPFTDGTYGTVIVSGTIFSISIMTILIINFVRKKYS